jgi:hypothetical protein
MKQGKLQIHHLLIPGLFVSNNFTQRSILSQANSSFLTKSKSGFSKVGFGNSPVSNTYYDQLPFLENVLCIARRMPHQYTTDHKSCLLGQFTQKLPIIRQLIICQILLIDMVASRRVFLGGVGGKTHACLITWCIARNYDAFFFSNLELLCNVHT